MGGHAAFESWNALRLVCQKAAGPDVGRSEGATQVESLRRAAPTKGLAMLRRHSLVPFLFALFVPGCAASSTVESESVGAAAEPIEVFCFPTQTAPTISAAAITGPDIVADDGTPAFGADGYSSVMLRSDIAYTAANFLHVHFEIPKCAALKTVRLGTKVLTTTSQGGFWYFLGPSAVQPTETNRAGWELSVFFPNQHDGETLPLTMEVAQGGSAISSKTFNIASVAKVGFATDIIPMTISDKEIKNSFSTGLYNKFNGTQNSAIVTASDGSQHHIYDLDQNHIAVNVDGNGVHFNFRFKVDVPNWCDPTADVGGTFRIEHDRTSGLFVEWPNGAPTVGLQWPSGCQALTGFIPIIGAIVWAIVDAESDTSSITQNVKDDVEKQVAGIGLPGAAGTLVDSISMISRELRFNLKFGLPSVDLNVPYAAFDSGRSGMLLAPGETVALLAHGLDVNSLNFWSGPNGLPNLYPSPAPLAEGFTRTQVGSLPFSGGNIAQAATRMGLATSIYSPGCKLTNTFTTQANLQFGVNDTPAEATSLRNSGGGQAYTLTALFPDSGFASILSTCGTQIPIFTFPGIKH